MHLLKALAGAFGYRLVQAQQHTAIEEHLARLLSSVGASCVVDVGANTGQYGVMLREIGYRGRIVSFEPLAEAFETLEARASADADWRVFRLALGAQPGTARLQVTRSTQFASLRAPSEYGVRTFSRFVPVERIEEVRVSTLAAEWPKVVEGIDRPVVYLKMDTQGYDLEVLEGAREVLPQVVALQSELAVKKIYEGAPDWLESLAALQARGFEPTGLFPITREDGRLSLIEMDCVMRRRDGGDSQA